MCLGLEYILESYNFFFFLHSFSWELHMLWPEKRDSTENRISTKRFRDSEKLKIFIRFNQKPEKKTYFSGESELVCLHLHFFEPASRQGLCHSVSHLLQIIIC